MNNLFYSKRGWRKILGLAATLALAGCYYSPPAVISPETTATLVGSRNYEASGDEIRFAAYQVDGRSRLAAAFRWNTPFPIEAGPHSLMIYMFRFDSNGIAVAYGMRKVSLTLQPGQNYHICGTNPVPYVGPDHVASGWANDAEFWIADDKGNPVTDRLNIFFQPPKTLLVLP
jgi:hypothetical protein